MNDSSQAEIDPLPSVVKVCPVLTFTGFLGAGKTTLLRELRLLQVLVFVVKVFTT